MMFLAQLGHTNRRNELARKDYIHIHKRYNNTFGHANSYQSYMEDNVSEVAKDIEDCSNITDRIHFGR